MNTFLLHNLASRTGPLKVRFLRLHTRISAKTCLDCFSTSSRLSLQTRTDPQVSQPLSLIDFLSRPLGGLDQTSCCAIELASVQTICGERPGRWKEKRMGDWKDRWREGERYLGRDCLPRLADNQYTCKHTILIVICLDPISTSAAIYTHATNLYQRLSSLRSNLN
jgi:hypothetical protein